MAVSGIFSVGGHGSVSFSRKTSNTGSASPNNEAQEAVFQPKKTQAVQENTVGGKLAKSLTGVAADMFSLLDDKGKETLESMVTAGMMKTDEVALGLRALATDKLFNRYAQERPRDEEDADILRVSLQQGEAFREHGARMGEIRGEYMQTVEKAMAQLQAKEIDAEGFRAIVHEPQMKMESRLADLRREQEQVNADNPYGDIINYSFKKNINGFNAAISGMTGDDLLMEFGSKEFAGKGLEAKNRLLEAFTAMHGEKEGDDSLTKMLKTFTAAVDIPGIGANGPPLAALLPESRGGALTAAAKGEPRGDEKLNALMDIFKSRSGGVDIKA
jgi:hypothetical protein